MRTTDAGHPTITRAASSLCSMSMKPLRSVTATPSAKLLSSLTRQLGQVGPGHCGAEAATESPTLAALSVLIQLGECVVLGCGSHQQHLEVIVSEV